MRPETLRQKYRKEVLEMLKSDLSEDPQDAYTSVGAEVSGYLSSIGKAPPKLHIPRWDYLNQFLDGFPPHQFSILCGPTGAGKTTLLASWTLAMAFGSIPAFVASVEISKEHFLEKLISGVLGQPSSELKPDDLEAARKKIISVLGIESIVLSNYDTRVDHIDLMADILHAHRENGAKIALLDNLNFMMEVKKAQDQIIAMDKTVHDFVIFCKRIPMHIVMVMHPRKGDGGYIASEMDVKGSSTSVQEATGVILFNRLEKPEDAPFGLEPNHCRELKIAKSRFNGRAVGKKIILAIHEKADLLREVGVK